MGFEKKGLKMSYKSTEKEQCRWAQASFTEAWCPSQGRQLGCASVSPGPFLLASCTCVRRGHWPHCPQAPSHISWLVRLSCETHFPLAVVLFFDLVTGSTNKRYLPSMYSLTFHLLKKNTHAQLWRPSLNPTFSVWPSSSSPKEMSSSSSRCFWN